VVHATEGDLADDDARQQTEKSRRRRAEYVGGDEPLRPEEQERQRG
jgi:hypothetical protein